MLRSPLAVSLACVLLLFAAFKIAHPDDLVIAVRYVLHRCHIRTISPTLVAGAIVSVETVVALWLLFWHLDTRPVWAFIGLIGAFTAVLGAFLLDPSAPRCGCAGIAIPGMGRTHEIMLGIARNILLLGAAAWLIRGRAPTGGIAPVRPLARGADHPPSFKRAFTIIEVLVSITVVAVLIALIVPALDQARESGRWGRSVSDQKQLIVALRLYADDAADAFPYFGPAHDPIGPIIIDGVDVQPVIGYFTRSSLYWGSLLYPQYVPTRYAFARRSRTLPDVDPRLPGSMFSSNHWLTQTACAAPEFFSQDWMSQGSIVYRATRWSETAYPSLKGLLIDVSTGYFEQSARGKYVAIGMARIPVGMADGSAAARPWRASDPTTYVERLVPGFIPWPIMATPDGLQGRDY